MTRIHTARGTVAKAIIAFAVLLPALLILATALRTRMQLTGLRIGSLTPWIIADGCLLSLGLMLHRGEDL
jgi:hypothetical protein